MPYLKHDRKFYLERYLDDILGQALTCGDVNYIITRLLHTFITDRGGDYAAYNEGIGVLECAKLELYRRKVAPYEDKKIRENGDV